MIVYGRAADRVGAVIQHSLAPPASNAATPELRRHVSIMDSGAYEQWQRRVRVDLDHDPARTIGRLAHLELTGNGELWAVAEVHALPDDRDLFWSPRIRYRDGGLAAERIRLEALALVHDPASAMLGPVRRLTLSLTDPLPTGVACRLPGWDRELLRRAISAHRQHRDGDPLEIVGHQADIEPRTRDQGADRPPLGPLRFGPAGRVISVR